MDIIELIRNQIKNLPEGSHLLGLNSVLRHIDAAYRHLERGQKQADESAFTDAIYRTNQAFEGSIKEAYRVLAGKDPQKTTPFDIEKYLQSHNLFKQRVLAQFSTYRTEWRNPSTHEYNLDFDEDEAFLAIVSVSAFTKLLTDQISEKLAYLSVKDDVKKQAPELILLNNGKQILIDRISDSFIKYFQDFVPKHPNLETHSESQLLGALRAFISTTYPDINVKTNSAIFLDGRSVEADMLVNDNESLIVVELKRYPNDRSRANGIRQLEGYLRASAVSGGILLLYKDKESKFKIENHLDSRGRTIKIIEPQF